jgi:hypothetical protein
VTLDKSDRSIVVNFEQPYKKLSPICVTLDKGDRSIVVKFEQYDKKLLLMHIDVVFDRNSFIFVAVKLLYLVSSFLLI